MAIRSQCLLLTIVCLSPHAAEAQVTPVVNPLFFGPTVGGRFSAGYDPVSGYRMATAELIRASSEATEARSRALINYEQARSQYIENADRWTDVYHERRRQNAMMEAYGRDESRARIQERLQNRPDPPPHTLGPAQLSPSTGDIDWPSTMLGDEYALLRAAIEKEFATLAQTSGAAGNTRLIRELTDQMREVLRANIREMPSYEYIAARKFIDGLANSAAVVKHAAAVGERDRLAQSDE